MKGTSFTYFTTDNAKSARELVAILRDAKSVVPPQLEEMSMFSGGGGGGRSSVLASFFSLSCADGVPTFQVDTAPTVAAAEVDSVEDIKIAVTGDALGSGGD